MSEVLAPIPMPAAGVHAEMNQNELPPTALKDAENWIFRDGRMRVRTGLTTIAASTADRPNGFFGYVDDAGSPVLLMGTDDTVFVFDDATQAWVDLSASFTAGVVESTIFEAFMLGAPAGPDTTVYIQNGKDRPKSWTYGAASVSNLAAGVPAGKAMMVLADRLIIGNIITNPTGVTYTGATGPTVVAVSANQDPAGGYAGADGLIVQLLDTPGAIVAMQEIGNLQGVIYKTDAIYIITASDSTSPFTVELKKAGVFGPVSPRAVVRASDGLQYYLARDGNVMVFDGIEPRPLGRHVQRYILDTWDIDTSYKAHAVYDDENRELVFFYPGVGVGESNRMTVVKIDDSSVWPGRFDTLRITAAAKASLPGGTTIGQLVGTVNAQTLTFAEYAALGQTFLYGELGGQCYTSSGTLDDAAAIPAYFETGSSGLDDPLRFKSIRYLDHLFSTAGDDQTVSIALKRTNYGEDLVSDSARTLNVGAGGPYRTHHRFPGRRYALRVSCNATEEVEWHGSTVVYAMQGRR